MALHADGPRAGGPHVGLVALLVVLAGCASLPAGPGTSPGAADGGTPSPGATGTGTPSPTPSPAVAPTATGDPTPTRTPIADPTKVHDLAFFPEETREAVAAALDAGGSVTREGRIAGTYTLARYPYVNYRDACYEVSNYQQILYVESEDRFTLRAVSPSAVENDSEVVAADDLPPIDRAAVDEALPRSHVPGYVGNATHVVVRRSYRYERNDTVRHVETASVVTEYEYVEHQGEYYAVAYVTALHTDLSEVVATTLVVERVHDEPCPAE